MGITCLIPNILRVKVNHHGLLMGRCSQVIRLVSVATLGTLMLAACGQQPETRVFFGEPLNASQVKSPFKVVMSSNNLVVEPAIAGAEYLDGHGHHHIIIDAPLPSLSQAIPEGSIQHLHFGKGQTEAVLDLEPGEHTLVLVFAKGDHVPWNPAITDAIKVTVVD